MTTWSYKDVAIVCDAHESEASTANLGRLAKAVNESFGSRLSVFGLLPDLEAEELAIASTVAASTGLPLNTERIKEPQGELSGDLKATTDRIKKHLEVTGSSPTDLHILLSARAEIGYVAANACRTSDLAIVAVGDHETACDMRDVAVKLVFESGRPVIVLPVDYASKELPKRIVVGWDGSKHSARALHDAIPLMKCADEVMLFYAEEDRKSDDTALSINSRAMLNLSSHGISGGSHIVDIAADESTSEALIRQISSTDCDLCVVGASDTSSVGRFLFGSTTEALMTELPRPLFIAH